MKHTKRFLMGFLVLIVLSWISNGFTLEKDTHNALNENIAQRTINAFSLNTHLKNNLGFENGVQRSPICIFRGAKIRDAAKGVAVDW